MRKAELRHRTETWERERLSPYACRSAESRGRERPEEECDVRTAFQRDRDRIIHSKSFRRLKHKTQVFIIPEGDHFRTRLTHTLEVAQIARTIARALQLNEDLTEAVALGHDLGHTPFGHTGEAALNEVHPGGFRHNEQSLRVVERLEGESGLNLTWEVRDGIANHTGPRRPATLEGQVVRVADRIAYINHDIDDALRGGVLTLDRLPADCLGILGRSHRTRINTMIVDLIETSRDQPVIAMSPRIGEAMDRLRQFMFDNVYISSEAKREEGKAMHVVQYLYSYFVGRPEALPAEFRRRAGEGGSRAQVVCDYIAGMTDRYAVAVFQDLFVPQGFPVCRES
ncbi:deoxyguanosinetriphosphate triphosphohydrolase [Candidatus Desulforudis audaxviator]|uniref:Deoxyguanosinetriphosphate triphosphohydrolase-like protein n=1 Tax=Desulforudis audaxviator (strain MP104C) TaxID=477974 RepID=B1I1T9_DESAP|nr:deoxyguanosinetriphosphate triphosphohydrolase [Candidatus Desulforudis audaxviator]ACA59036.1 putative deoxyguanosinetriphosphate triphosphohydrolase [Candidatus Desulforudis audaxviator MP104C]AZK59082.1 dNTP triphosphohydrolase, broad substrate specificity, subgroup 2 [Candidatus Desulforudis audaxviator]